jgi:hypothetical protein
VTAVATFGTLVSIGFLTFEAWEQAFIGAASTFIYILLRGGQRG